MNYDLQAAAIYKLSHEPLVATNRTLKRGRFFSPVHGAFRASGSGPPLMRVAEGNDIRAPFISPVHGAFRASGFRPAIDGGLPKETTSEPRSRGFSRFGFS